MDMKLKAVYFHNASPTGLPYRKALVYEQDVSWFLEKGAVEEQPTKAPPEKPQVVVGKAKPSAKPKAKAKS